MQTEWTDTEYGGSQRIYMDGLVTGHVSYAITGESGYIARVGRLTLKKRFEYIGDAQRTIDKLILRRCAGHVSDIGYTITK